MISEHGSSWIVPRLVGAGRALDLLWSSRRVDATEAHRIGMVDYLTEPAELLCAHRSTLELDVGAVDFTTLEDERDDGLAAVVPRATDLRRALTAAEERGLRSGDCEITLCGTKFVLVPA